METLTILIAVLFIVIIAMAVYIVMSNQTTNTKLRQLGNKFNASESQINTTNHNATESKGLIQNQINIMNGNEKMTTKNKKIKSQRKFSRKNNSTKKYQNKSY